MKRMLSNHSVAHKKLIMKAVGENTPDTAVSMGIEGNWRMHGCWMLIAAGNSTGYVQPCMDRAKIKGVEGGEKIEEYANQS